MTNYQKGLSIYFTLLGIFWILLAKSGLKDSFWNYFYSFAFSLIPFFGGVIGFSIARRWGYLKSALGKSILSISLGSFFWGIGNLIWAYYNFFSNIAVPYPSLADVGFILAIPFWSVGMVYLSKATGAKFGLNNSAGKIFIVVSSIVLTLLSYYLLVVVARGGMIATDESDIAKLFFDFVYPIGDVIILVLATGIFGLSFHYFGGLYKKSIYSLLVGFGTMYIADMIFSYTTTTETFYTGNFGDLIFTVALFLITYGIFGLSLPVRTPGDSKSL